MSERGIAASIFHRHGAYLIAWRETQENHGYATPDQLYDCASSLAVAKRLARETALDMDWEGPFHWSFANGWWDLEGNE